MSSECPDILPLRARRPDAARRRCGYAPRAGRAILCSAALAGAAGLAGCATESRIAGTRVLTVATAGDTVLVGYANSRGSTGRFQLDSVHGAPVTCEGRFRYHAASRRRARFDCTNGDAGPARIEAGQGLSGEGTGESSLGEVHILYGHALEAINARMRFPDGRVLVQTDAGIALVARVAD